MSGLPGKVEASAQAERERKRRKTRVKKIREGFILPSAAFTVARSQVHGYRHADKSPEAGDLAYGTVCYIGQHSSLENKEGRIHAINDGTKAIFVFGNRYAPDFYEGSVPREFPKETDMLARSGIVGEVKCKNANVKDPTRVRLLGYVCDQEGAVLNTRSFSRIASDDAETKEGRAKMILNIGTSMNSGKSMTAAACCWALSTMGRRVRGSKITGTAGLKDILLMEDNGAHPVADFTHLGYPSTYLVDREDLMRVFRTLDSRYAGNPKNYWVVEIADGILQRETAMLLQAEEVRSRIHRLIFSAHDAFGAIGGLKVLKEKFGLVPDAISGVCSGSPLSIRELEGFTDRPIFDSIRRDLERLAAILI